MIGTITGIALTVAYGYVVWRWGYERGYGDAVKEYLDNLARRPDKNWYKDMKKRKETE